MFCPRCANTAIEGQRFCKNCGMNLGVIVDALEGKRGPLDFELLKRDLRELGANLRAGFEDVSNGLRGTARLGNKSRSVAGIENEIDRLLHSIDAQTNPSVLDRNITSAVETSLRKIRLAHSRHYSLQQAILNLFGGGAMLGVWYFLLNRITSSGLIESIEKIILVESGYEVVGVGALLQSLWLLALIPLATGVAHLFNAIFLAPRKEEPGPPPVYVPPPPPPVVEPLPTPLPAPVSIVEDQTLRLEREK